MGCLVDPRLAPASTVAQEGEGEARHLSPARLLPLLELGEVPMGVVRALLCALAACGVLPEDWPQRAQRIRGAMQGGTACEECGEAVRVVFATPCGHLLCPDCTSRDSTACSHCRAPYKMQVGCCGRLAVRSGCCIWPDAWPCLHWQEWVWMLAWWSSCSQLCRKARAACHLAQLCCCCHALPRYSYARPAMLLFLEQRRPGAAQVQPPAQMGCAGGAH